MAIDPEDLLPRKKQMDIQLGQDVSAISEDELAARIVALNAEIQRYQIEISARQASKSAAAAIFKR